MIVVSAGCCGAVLIVAVRVIEVVAPLRCPCLLCLAPRRTFPKMSLHCLQDIPWTPLTTYGPNGSLQGDKLG